MSVTDTIFALSSGGLPSGVAVIRLSGPLTSNTIRALCGDLPAPRMAVLRFIRDRNNALLDQGLVLFFKAPASFTGEDCAELQVHGGRAVIRSLLDALEQAGLRQAFPGEFSRRAFQNGKLDLVEIEGLADLISAETDMQRRLALEHSRGHLSSLYAGWAKRLTHARAMIEAELDFADEEDVPGSVASTIWVDMDRLKDEIDVHLRGAGVAEIVKDGLNIVIAGAPNAGKSSLLNALAQRDVAIVTDIAGTTRDILTVDLSLAGFIVKLSDTAGLRETEDVVEREGVRRARSSLENADLVLLMAEEPGNFELLRYDSAAPVIRIASKIDKIPELWDRMADCIQISTVTGQGIDTLIEAIKSYLPDMSSSSAFAVPTRRRHVECLTQAKTAIEESLSGNRQDLDIKAEHLRQASDSLGRITGRIDVEDLLDVIFSEFCVGK